jgi:FkbM family methyltransferase
LAAVTGADVIAIEPIPEAFNILQKNIAINNFNSNIKLYNIGLSDTSDILYFTNNLDTINHVIPEYSSNSISVKVQTLDSLINNGSVPVLMKIDVEGFELKVLSGSVLILKNPILKAIIIETNNSGINYGHTDFQIHNLLESYGFERIQYNPFSREIKTSLKKMENSIYIRDKLFVLERLQQSKSYKLINGTI